MVFSAPPFLGWRLRTRGRLKLRLLRRYHNVGILVLFLHDINDIQLEFSKLNIYLKSRGGGYYLLNDVLSNMGSVSFSITWSVSATPSLSQTELAEANSRE